MQENCLQLYAQLDLSPSGICKGEQVTLYDCAETTHVVNAHCCNVQLHYHRCRTANQVLLIQALHRVKEITLEISRK